MNKSQRCRVINLAAKCNIMVSHGDLEGFEGHLVIEEEPYNGGNCRWYVIVRDEGNGMFSLVESDTSDTFPRDGELVITVDANGGFEETPLAWLEGEWPTTHKNAENQFRVNARRDRVLGVVTG